LIVVKIILVSLCKVTPNIQRMQKKLVLQNCIQEAFIGKKGLNVNRFVNTQYIVHTPKSAFITASGCTFIVVVLVSGAECKAYVVTFSMHF
jgi:hypothetical protein